MYVTKNVYLGAPPKSAPTLWELTIFKDTGNTLDKYLKIDTYWIKLGHFTYAHMCGISKGLLDTLILQRKGARWTQQLDYKNIAFQCGICHQGHLHDSCFQAWVYSNRKKGH